MTTEPTPGAAAPGPAAPSIVDGQWHRLHPATPLLRGGVIFIAILGFLIVQFRDAFIAIFLGGVVGRDLPEDPMTRWLAGNTLLALGIAIGVIVLVIAGGWLSWRMHAYRVTDELIEEREGIIWRRHRRGRLDRLQGVDITRPIFARIFGAARLEISMAGNDSSIRLSYVSSAHANELRAQILAAARARRAAEAGETAESEAGERADAAESGALTVDSAESPSLGDRIAARANELLAPELDQPVQAGSLVEMHAGRLVGATALRMGPVLLAVLVGAVLAAIYRPFLLLGVIPGVIAIYGIAIREVVRSLRYSIAATPDGIRVGFGLLSTTNETLPPGRVHAIQLYQPVFWRPFGWWSVRINRASNLARQAASGQVTTTILPVGTMEEALRVVGLVLPEWAEPESFTTSPRRGRWLRWFSWRRNGFAFDDRTVVIRRGRFWRSLVLVPLARVQSVAIHDGPLTRAMRLAEVNVHTVAGVVRARVGALDADDAVELWRGVETRALEAMA